MPIRKYESIDAFCLLHDLVPFLIYDEKFIAKDKNTNEIKIFKMKRSEQNCKKSEQCKIDGTCHRCYFIFEENEIPFDLEEYKEKIKRRIE